MMHELHIGSIDVESSAALNELMGGSAFDCVSGHYDIVGRVDEESRKFVSGALVRNIGNDQWAVHLLNVQQLARLVESELAKTRGCPGNELEVEQSVGPGAMLDVAGHVLGMGPAMAVAGPALELATTALNALAFGTDAKSRDVAEDLIRSGAGRNSIEGAREGAKRLAPGRRATGNDFLDLAATFERNR